MCLHMYVAYNLHLNIYLNPSKINHSCDMNLNKLQALQLGRDNHVLFIGL